MHGALGGPGVPEVSHCDRVVGVDGVEVAGDVGTSTVERRPHGAGFLQVPKVDLHPEALQWRGVQLGQRVQRPQRVWHVPSGQDGIGSLGNVLRHERHGVHCRCGCRVQGVECGRLNGLGRFLSASEEPFPPCFSFGLGGVGLGERRLRNGGAGRQEPHAQAKRDGGLHGAQRYLRHACRRVRGHTNLCEPRKTPELATMRFEPSERF